MITIYDAVEWETMPQGVPILVYRDGNYVTYPEALALRPSMVFTVTTTGKTRCDIADCESGDLTPSQAIFGIRLGYWHTIYASLDTLPALKAAAVAQGSPRWSWFAADPTGVPHLPEGASACQYAWHSLDQCPANYDMSIATEAWAKNAQPPIHLPSLEEAVIMGITEMSNGNLAVDAVGAVGSPSQGHQLVFIVNPVTEKSAVIDATDGVGPLGPDDSLYTVQ